MTNIPGPRARKRLTHMLRVLEALPPEQHFDLELWAGFVDKKGITSTDRDHLPEPCGTTACACGYAALDPWFQKQGLTLHDKDTEEKIANVKAFNASLKTAVQYDLRFRHTAPCDFFGITNEAFDALFLADSYAQPTRHNVIRRIRGVLNKPDTARRLCNPFFSGD